MILCWLCTRQSIIKTKQRSENWVRQPGLTDVHFIFRCEGSGGLHHKAGLVSSDRETQNESKKPSDSRRVVVRRLRGRSSGTVCCS